MNKALVIALCTAMLGNIVTPSFAQQSPTPGVAAFATVTPAAAPQLKPDGTSGPQISDREGNTKVALGHAEYTESARRGKLYTLASTALTVTAAHVSAGAVGTLKPILGFYNPLGSGVNAVLINARAFHTSGTTGGPLMWNFLCGQNWTPAAGGSIFNDLLSNVTPNGSFMVAQNNVIALSNSVITTAFNVLAPFGGPDNTALSSGGEAGHYEDLKGQIVVPPGCEIALTATATGTSDVVSASMSWEEIAP